MFSPNDPFETNNPFQPNTPERFTRGMVNQAQERQAAQFNASGPMTFGRSLGPLVIWCGLFAVGIFGSTGASRSIGHILLIGGLALAAMAVAVAGYSFLVRPLVKLTGWTWRGNALVRSVMVGAALGIGFGAWLGASYHEVLRGVVRLGIMGTVLGLFVGLVLLIVAKASKRPPG